MSLRSEDATRRNHGHAKAVGNWVPRLTQKACEKHGFSAAALFADWSQIAGERLSRHTAPVRLKWPRPLSAKSETDPGCGGRPGAILTLRTDPAVALDVQYGTAQLIERINGYFGYRAVSDIRIIQAPLTPLDTSASHAGRTHRPEPQRAARHNAAKPREAIEIPKGIKDSALRHALERLAMARP